MGARKKISYIRINYKKTFNIIQINDNKWKCY